MNTVIADEMPIDALIKAFKQTGVCDAKHNLDSELMEEHQLCKCKMFNRRVNNFRE